MKKGQEGSVMRFIHWWMKRTPTEHQMHLRSCLFVCHIDCSIILFSFHAHDTAVLLHSFRYLSHIIDHSVFWCTLPVNTYWKDISSRSSVPRSRSFISSCLSVHAWMLLGNCWWGGGGRGWVWCDVQWKDGRGSEKETQETERGGGGGADCGQRSKGDL